jgi:hypothetical protein
MSKVRAEQYTNRAGSGAPEIPYGVTVPSGASIDGAGGLNLTGIATAGSFKGNLTGDVSGNVTGLAATFTGPVTIGGTLTYEDVTNIDAVGVITARDGIKVTSGGIDITGNIGLGGATYGSSGQVLTSGGSGANATWTTISAAPEFTATASGAIANGKTIILNSDATVSVAATTLTPESVGSVVEIDSPAGGTRMLASTWMSDTKVIVAWSLVNDPKYLYMAVGTVSGTSITYGTPTQFPNNTKAYSAGLIWDTSVNAGFIALSDNWESKFYAYGFTISGTTVNVRAYNSSGYWEYGSLTNIRCVRAASNNKGGFAFVSIDSNGLFQSWAGTLNSSANISVGGNSNTYSGFWAGQYQYGNTICDIAYAPDLGTSTSSTFGVSACHGNGTSLRCALLTDVNDGGTSHTMNSFTSLVTIDNSQGASLTYNTEFNCFYMIYRVSSTTYSRTWTAQSNGTSVQDIASMAAVAGYNSGYGCQVKYNPGTKKAYITLSSGSRLNGWEISFASNSSITTGPIQNITATGTETERFTMAANNTGGKVFAAASDASNPFYGDTHIWQAEIITTNVTANNFLGFSADAYTNGQTVTIKTVGNVDANQTGLSTASKYYLTNGGDLSLTADDPSVYAGLALNSTSIAVKFPV